MKSLIRLMTIRAYTGHYLHAWANHLEPKGDNSDPTLPYPTIPYPTIPFPYHTIHTPTIHYPKPFPFHTYPTLPYPTLPHPPLPYPILPYPTIHCHYHILPYLYPYSYPYPYPTPTINWSPVITHKQCDNRQRLVYRWFSLVRSKNR